MSCSQMNGCVEMLVGQLVRVVKIPESLPDDHELKTKEIFEKALGKTFRISDFQGELLVLDVGELRGKASCLETIYIEPECVESVEANRD